MAKSSLSLVEAFAELKDPRASGHGRQLHLLIDIIAIAICGVICGCDDWPAIEMFGHTHHDWLKRFLRLPHGIPSHDTFERVMDRLKPRTFQRCLVRWTHALQQALGLHHIAIDGKTLRRSGNSSGLAALHLVSAWASGNHLTLGQVAVEDKSNEITAIPKLLTMLDIEGALVTIDAMGCQKEIAKKIVAKGGDYVLTVKDNQPHLLEDIKDCFCQAWESDFQGVQHDIFETEEKGHGRHERRSYTVIYDPSGIRHVDAWEELCVIGMCYSERTVNGKTSEEGRYFIGSRRAGAKVYGQALRKHWSIENNLHWQMDVSFAEDRSRIQKRHGAENFAMLRRVGLSLLKRHPAKESIATKRLHAAMDTKFLEEVLNPTKNG